MRQTRNEKKEKAMKWLTGKRETKQRHHIRTVTRRSTVSDSRLNYRHLFILMNRDASVVHFHRLSPTVSLVGKREIRNAKWFPICRRMSTVTSSMPASTRDNPEQKIIIQTRLRQEILISERMTSKTICFLRLTKLKYIIHTQFISMNDGMRRNERIKENGNDKYIYSNLD